MTDFLADLGISEVNSGAYSDHWIEKPSGEALVSFNPATGEPISTVMMAGADDYEAAVAAAEKTFGKWRMMPAPQRGEVVRKVGEELRRFKEPLGRLVTLEMGKILTEGEGEVQEMIDIADFAVGLSRQLYGNAMHSERPLHRMYEQWHPLGPIGIISAFNFPVAVWSWNAMIAAVCGDTMLWKPSPETPLTAIAVQNIVNRVTDAEGLQGLFTLAMGDVPNVGERMIADRRLPLISATGSCAMGRRVGQVVAGRMGRSLLELGGNNALIVLDDADTDLAMRAILFGAVGTAGQRCTSTRRVFMQKGVAEKITDQLLGAYKTISIGDPQDPKTLMGPLITQDAVQNVVNAVVKVREQGGEVLCGGEAIDGPGYFCQPTIVRGRPDMDIVKHETFGPLLYLFTVDSLDEAMQHHNSVDQGLSSAIFTRNLQKAEEFLSHRGSDCGIANVNIGTSGAEIGGAFGGEKDTGGGREAGSDSWKAYMRRQTNTINWSNELPLAQGVQFG